jgi:hypothetical protein
MSFSAAVWLLPQVQAAVQLREKNHALVGERQLSDMSTWFQHFTDTAGGRGSVLAVG